MKFLKKLLNAPIRNTALVLLVSLAAYLLLTFASLYLTRAMCEAAYLDIGSCRGTSLQMFVSMILSDFEFVFRVVAELSVILLIVQGIHRITRKNSK